MSKFGNSKFDVNEDFHKEATDHAEELAKLLERYIALVKEDKKYKSSAYGVWAKKTDIADQRILEGEALSALNNYREATK